MKFANMISPVTLLTVALMSIQASTAHAATLSNLPSPDRPTVASQPVGVSNPSAQSGDELRPAGSQTNALGSFHINLNPSQGLQNNAAALSAFQNAATSWETRIADPITVNIDAGLADFSSDTNPDNNNVIGQTDNDFVGGGFDTIRNAIAGDSTSEVDDTINASLPTASTFRANVPTDFTLQDQIALTRANAKSLGFSISNPTDPDASITFNSNFDFDFDNSDGVNGSDVDFQTVAAHEIGHALGFVSVVDQIDQTFADPNDNLTPGPVSINPLDLYRFKDDSADDPTTPAEFALNNRDLVPGNTDITDFVLATLGDEQIENLMSTGQFAGDGRQASHWKDNNLSGDLIGILDPTLARGQTIAISDADFRALDLIGYDIAFAIPEPTSLALLASGVLVVLLSSRRRVPNRPVS